MNWWFWKNCCFVKLGNTDPKYLPPFSIPNTGFCKVHNEDIILSKKVNKITRGNFIHWMQPERTHFFPDNKDTKKVLMFNWVPLVISSTISASLLWNLYKIAEMKLNAQINKPLSSYKGAPFFQSMEYLGINCSHLSHTWPSWVSSVNTSDKINSCIHK